MLQFVAAIALALVLSSCISSSPPTEPVTSQAAPQFPFALYEKARTRGDAVYRLDPAASEITVRVYRAGALARFGHDHIVATRETRGYVTMPADLNEAAADFHLRVESLQVDEPAKRAEAGFESTPSAKEVEGTRRNMLEKVLEAERYPWVVLRVRGARGSLPKLQLNVQLTLHGVTRTFPVEATVDTDGGSLAARGRFTIKQTDFGMTPYAVLGGALAVRDELDLEFRFAAARVAAAVTAP